VRNILVHNFGIIDRKFKSKVKTGFNINEKFPINNSYTNQSFNLINDIMFDLFLEISSRIFDKEYSANENGIIEIVREKENQ